MGLLDRLDKLPLDFIQREWYDASSDSKGRKMSPGSVLKNAALQATPRPDRRLHTRYPIRLDLQYKLLNQGVVNRTGSGRTLNMGTGGIFFESKRPLPHDDEIDLEMTWPVLLDGVCPLKLIVHGRIVRSDNKGTAVRVRSYDFRTSKRSATRRESSHARSSGREDGADR